MLERLWHLRLEGHPMCIDRRSEWLLLILHRLLHGGVHWETHDDRGALVCRILLLIWLVWQLVWLAAHRVHLVMRFGYRHDRRVRLRQLLPLVNIHNSSLTVRFFLKRRD